MYQRVGRRISLSAGENSRQEYRCVTCGFPRYNYPEAIAKQKQECCYCKLQKKNGEKITHWDNRHNKY